MNRVNESDQTSDQSITVVVVCHEDSDDNVRTRGARGGESSKAGGGAGGGVGTREPINSSPTGVDQILSSETLGNGCIGTVERPLSCHWNHPDCDGGVLGVRDFIKIDTSDTQPGTALYAAVPTLSVATVGGATAATVGGATTATVGGAMATTVGGVTATVGGVTAATGNGATAATVGGVTATVGGVTAATGGGATAATVGGVTATVGGVTTDDLKNTETKQSSNIQQLRHGKSQLGVSLHFQGSSRAHPSTINYLFEPCPSCTATPLYAPQYTDHSRTVENGHVHDLDSCPTPGDSYPTPEDMRYTAAGSAGVLSRLAEVNEFKLFLRGTGGESAWCLWLDIARAKVLKEDIEDLTL